MGEYVTLNNLPISFPVLSVPKPSKKRKTPKYSCAIAFKREDQMHMYELKKLQDAVERCRSENSATELPNLGPSKNNPGMILANTASNPDYPPALRDAGNNEIDRMIAAQEFYPGAICNYVVDVYYVKDHDRVCLSILGVQKMADGPRLDNRPDDASLFGAAPQAPPTPPPQPQTGQQQYGQPFPNATTPHDPLG